MLNFDVVFVDTTCPKPYDNRTLRYEPLGGTEASVVRIAEALGLVGLTVGVVQHNREGEIQMGDSAFYIPHRVLRELRTKTIVSIRGVNYLDKFPAHVKKIMWMHDVAGPYLYDMDSVAKFYDATVVGVSQWHRTNLREFMPTAKIKYIYNPVPDGIYVPKDETIEYDKYKLLWAASPHKGLMGAIDMFERLKDVANDDKFELHIFNPGYANAIAHSEVKGVVKHGPVACEKLWEHMSTSLCVFYPTQWKETFGLIAAEANAVRCPVATYELAALRETASGKHQKVGINDTKALIDQVISWHNGNRPSVYGNNEFRLSEVVCQWIKLLTS